MVNNFTKLGIRAETKKLLLTECKKEFLNHHPEMQHINITQDKILFEICQYYLNN